MNDIAKDFKKYLDFKNSEECRYFRNLYSRNTIFDITGISRQENPHSSFIKWLLDINGSHGLNEYPFKRFLETVCFAYFKYGKSYLNKDNDTFKKQQNQESIINKMLFFDSNTGQPLIQLMNGDFKIKDFSIEREHVIEKKRRADIWLTFSALFNNAFEKKIAILIENKVGSSENDNQTESYMNSLLNSDFDYIIPIFMYPASNKELYEDVKTFRLSVGKNKKPCVNRLFLLFSYQYFLDGVLINCLNEVEKTSAAYQYINEYIICLGRADVISVDGEKNGGNTNKILMATRRSDTEKAMALWKKHSDTILAVEKSMLEEGDENPVIITEGESELYSTIFNHIRLLLLEKEEKEEGLTEKEKEFLKGIESLNNETAYYINDGKEYIKFIPRGEHNIGELAYRMIEYYAKNHANKSVQELRNTLSIKSKWLRNIVITEDEVKELFEHWKQSPNQKPKCTYTSKGKTIVENGVLNGCPLNDNKENPLNKKSKELVDQTILDGHACPLINKSNQELFDVFRKNYYCQCFYDFLHYFFIGDETNNQYLKEFSKTEDVTNLGINTSFRAIDYNGNKLYIARFWNKDNIKTIIKKLQLEEYVSIKPESIKKELK